MPADDDSDHARPHGRDGSLRSVPDEASYLCDSCGESIVIPIDATAGQHQEYVEDCPVCCNANLIRVRLAEDGEPRVSARSE